MAFFKKAAIILAYSLASCAKSDTPDPDPEVQRQKFVGTWNCQENSSISGTVIPYSVIIKSSAASSVEVLIENLYRLGTQNQVIATINGSNISFTNQLVGPHTLNGSGLLTGSSTISLDYTVFDGVRIDTLSASLAKQ